MLSQEEQEEFRKTQEKEQEVLRKICNLKMQIQTDEETMLFFDKYRNATLEQLDRASRWCVIGGGYDSVADMLDAIQGHIDKASKAIKRLCLRIPDGYFKLNDGSTLLN